jgi:formylglycine-generating enzyme required for sulfatase activity
MNTKKQGFSATKKMACMLGAMALLLAADSANADRRPEFSWTPVENATWHQLWINRNGRTYQTPWVEGAATWTPSENGLPGGTYRWWVRGWGPEIGMGTWAAEPALTVETKTPGSIALIAPEGVQATHELTFRWEKDADATWYRLWVGRDGAATWHDRWFNLFGTGEASVNPGGTHPGPAKPVQTAPEGTIADNNPTFEWAGGGCTWWLRAWGPDGYGPWSGPGHFSIPYPVGTWFRIYASRGGTKVVDSWTQDGELISPEHLASGEYRWWLGVWDAVGKRTIWSDRMDFTVQLIPGMALIPGGTNAGTDPDPEYGEYSLTVDSFYMDKHLISLTQWNEVYAWAVTNGYSFNNAGSGKAWNHPVHTISWYDSLKWCNARSEMDGFEPVYYTDESFSDLYKTGQDPFNPAELPLYAKESADGYRLATAEEWEYAARGGLASKRFPWGDTISHANANYWCNQLFDYDVNPRLGPHPDYSYGAEPYTNPVDAFAPNGYGLHDMAGNLWQYLWSASSDFPQYQQARGGGWAGSAGDCPIVCEMVVLRRQANEDGGFRTVRRAVPD